MLKVEKRHEKLGKTGLYYLTISNRENWSLQLDHKQFSKGTEQGVRKEKRSLLACYTRCKWSMETTRSSRKVKIGIKVMKYGTILMGMEVTVAGWGSECYFTCILLSKIPLSTIKLPTWRFQAFNEVSLFEEQYIRLLHHRQSINEHAYLNCIWSIRCALLCIRQWTHKLETVPGMGSNPTVDTFYFVIFCLFRALRNSTGPMQIKSRIAFIRGNRGMERERLFFKWRRS